MTSSAETVSESSLGKDDNLHQAVLASFPLCDLTEEDLTQNPKLCKLLATLSKHVDPTGLSAPLKTELEQAEQKLQKPRRHWLQVESLRGTLQEMIQDHRAKKHRTTLPPDVIMFYDTLERCLLVAQCVRQLDLSTAAATPPTPTTQPGLYQPSLLGLEPQQVLELLPADKTVQRMKQSLPKELERHLKTKCFSLLSYYQPDWESDSDSLKNVKLANLSGQLDREKKRAESLKEGCREKAALLQRQTQLYLLELTKCIQLLQSLILDHRLTIQTQLDGKKLEYMEAKCELVMQKIRMESVEIRLDTYTADTIAAHKKIRDLLESELKDGQLEKESVQTELASFEMLGTEFEALADEYASLQGQVNMKKWALKELS